MDLFDQDVLCFEPWPFEEGHVVVLRDYFLTTRTAHECVHCGDDIVAGERVRARAEVDRDSKLRMTFYFCRLCCDAMRETVQSNDCSAFASRGR